MFSHVHVLLLEVVTKPVVYLMRPFVPLLLKPVHSTVALCL